jgi:hypothetical protein
MNQAAVFEETVFCTIASSEYEPMVKLLVDSFFKFHPQSSFIVFSGDEYDLEGSYATKNLEFRKLDFDAFSGSKKQAYSRVKPSVLKGLMKEGWQSIIFLDPDMLVISSLVELIDVVKKNALTLTPHILHVSEENPIPGLDKILLNAGMFNAGFIGLRHSQEVFDFLGWWESRTLEYGILYPNSGLYFDQRWLDLAPGYVGEICVLRDPGINAGYFNLSSRKIEMENGDFFVNGSKLKLLHFSGFEPDMLPISNLYNPHVSISSFGPLERVFSLYAQDLLALGWKPRIPDSKMMSAINSVLPILFVAKKSQTFRFFWSKFLRTSIGQKLKLLALPKPPRLFQ